MRFKIKNSPFLRLGVITITVLTAAILWQLQISNGQVAGTQIIVNDYPKTFWRHQCVDTMKYSRDTARAWNHRPAELTELINKQMDAIAEIGATCVAIGTPYEDEFVPFMRQWVDAARIRGMNIWFRGNIAGFEGWFDYKPLKNLSEHHAKIYTFITKHAGLFEEGDVFTPSPESENKLLYGGWTEAKVKTLRSFLIDSFNNCQNAFAYISVPVECGYFSSNGDVARDAMNSETVQKSGNLVVIDHYVKTAERMEKDILDLKNKYSARVAIGEWGAPIPDINGEMTQAERKTLIASWLDVFYRNRRNIRAINYWTLTGGSTALYPDDVSAPTPAVDALKQYYRPVQITGRITDPKGNPLPGIPVSLGEGAKAVQETVTDFNGEYGVLVPVKNFTLTLGGNGSQKQEFKFKPKPSDRYTQDAKLVLY